MDPICFIHFKETWKKVPSPSKLRWLLLCIWPWRWVHRQRLVYLFGVGNGEISWSETKKQQSSQKSYDGWRFVWLCVSFEPLHCQALWQPCAICKAQTVDLLATCCDHLNVWLPEPVVVTWAAWTPILCHFMSFPSVVCLANRVPIDTFGFTPLDFRL